MSRTSMFEQIRCYPLDRRSSILCHAYINRVSWSSATGHVAVAEPTLHLLMTLHLRVLYLGSSWSDTGATITPR